MKFWRKLLFTAILASACTLSAQAVQAARTADADTELLAHAIAVSYPDVDFGAKVGIASAVLHRLRTPGFPDSMAAVLSAPDSGFPPEALAAPVSDKERRMALDACRAALRGADPCAGMLRFARLPQPGRGVNRPSFEKERNLVPYAVVIGQVGFWDSGTA